MKKKSIFSFLIALLLGSLIVQAQDIIIKDYSGNDVTNSTFTHSGGQGLQEVSLKIEMRPGVIVDTYLSLERFEEKACPTTQNYFCWTLCYGAVNAGDLPVWTDGPILVEVDSVFDEFHAYYDSKGTNADAEYLYVIHDTSGVYDSSWVLIHYDYGQPNYCADTTGTGFSNLDEIELRLFPNPASDVFVISNTKSNDKVELIDILGKVVYNNSKASSVHQLKGVKQGLYMVRVTRNGEVIYTDRLIVN